MRACVRLCVCVCRLPYGGQRTTSVLSFHPVETWDPTQVMIWLDDINLYPLDHLSWPVLLSSVEERDVPRAPASCSPSECALDDNDYLVNSLLRHFPNPVAYLTLFHALSFVSLLPISPPTRPKPDRALDIWAHICDWECAFTFWDHLSPKECSAGP